MGEDVKMSIGDAPEIEIKRIDLETIKLGVQQYISAELAEDFAIAPDVQLLTHTLFNLDELVLQIRQKVLSQELEKVEYPADWWQHVKERFAPKWVRQRWPVRYRVLEIRALYPKIALPKERHTIAITGDYKRYGRNGDA